MRNVWNKFRKTIKSPKLIEIDNFGLGFAAKTVRLQTDIAKRPKPVKQKQIQFVCYNFAIGLPFVAWSRPQSGLDGILSRSQEGLWGGVLRECQ